MTTLDRIDEEHLKEATGKAYRMYLNDQPRLGSKALVRAIQKYRIMGSKVERRLLVLEGASRRK